MTVVAYTPKEAFRDPDALGAVYVNDTTEVNVRELFLASATGTFVVEDPVIQAVLDNYEPLKRAKVPDEPPVADPPAPTATIATMAKPDLLKLPEAEHVENARNLKVEDLRIAIAAKRGGDS